MLPDTATAAFLLDVGELALIRCIQIFKTSLEEGILHQKGLRCLARLVDRHFYEVSIASIQVSS